ncbi:TetR/AcrR family transcriptional regulator [Verrucomicrobiales bacterium]|nr:TetR/AcrR family transcriptional regulator [Verrucomicrobiales bacterium]MDC0275564.1 TetR/AcrR family transcriptional regulator [Verrucomicrobiales bacterium]MDC0314686.1 TetR/AcrR family transcriptional regulator [bacterium]
MRKANAKDRLLTTAGQLFNERGYSEVGINEIIKTAETAKASFYQHFASKEALCEAWLDAIHDRSEKGRENILASSGDPCEKIANYFKTLEDYLVESNFRGCPFSNTATVTGESCCGIRKRVEDHKVSIREFFQTLVAQFVASKERAHEIGDRLFIIYSGAGSETQNVREMWPIQTARRAAVEICQAERKTKE